jgi:hypothetical protein
MRRVLLFVVIIFSLSVVGYGFYFLNNVLHFSKSVTVESTTDFENLIKLDHSNALDVEPLIRSIPYKVGFSYVVDPAQKYELSILNGQGDCSNFSFGLSYLLSKRKIDYSIVHFIRVDGELLSSGHVALQTVYEYRGQRYSGVIDLLEGGLPSKRENFLKIQDLISEDKKDFTITSLNTSHDERSTYYEDDFLSNSVVGVMTSEEVESYFSFLDKYYMDLGNVKIEKYVYDLAAVIFGKYPTIYVTEKAYDEIFGEHQLLVFYAKLILWTIRMIPILFAVFLLVIGLRAVSGKHVRP